MTIHLNLRRHRSVRDGSRLIGKGTATIRDGLLHGTTLEVSIGAPLRQGEPIEVRFVGVINAESSPLAAWARELWATLEESGCDVIAGYDTGHEQGGAR